MRLLLIRHAAAEERSERRWPDDGRRPLTSEGRSAFVVMVRAIGDRLSRLDLTLSSGLVRAWQTAELLHEAGGAPAPVREPGLELAGPGAILRAIERAVECGRRADEARLALIGHEPDLSAVATLLVVGQSGPAVFRMRKGAMLALHLPTSSFGPPRGDEPTGRRGGGTIVEWMTHPKLIGRVEPD